MSVYLEIMDSLLESEADESEAYEENWGSKVFDFVDKMSDEELKEKYERCLQEDDELTSYIGYVITSRKEKAYEAKIAALEKEKELLEKELRSLKTHILSMPDGEAYFEAKKHYEEALK